MAVSSCAGPVTTFTRWPVVFGSSASLPTVVACEMPNKKKKKGTEQAPPQGPTDNAWVRHTAERLQPDRCAFRPGVSPAFPRALQKFQEALDKSGHDEDVEGFGVGLEDRCTLQCTAASV